MMSKAAADEEMVGVDALAVDARFGAKAANVTDVVLGARIWATGDMNVDRLIEFDSFLERLDQLQRMALGVGLSEFAIAVTRAGDNAARKIRLARGEAHFFERLLYGRNESIGNIWYNEI